MNAIQKIVSLFLFCLRCVPLYHRPSHSAGWFPISQLSAIKSSLRQKTEELSTAEESLTRLKTERSHVSEIIRQEFADRIVATEEDAKRVRMEMSELKARHRHEIEKAREDVVRALKVR